MKEMRPVTLNPPSTRYIVCLVSSDIVSALPVKCSYGYCVTFKVFLWLLRYLSSVPMVTATTVVFILMLPKETARILIWK